MSITITKYFALPTISIIIAFLYRVLIFSTVFFFNFAEMMLISTLTNVFQKFSQDDEIINFTREMREPVVSQYDTKNNLFSKF